MAGDAFLTVALAGSLFFTVSPGEARPKVLLYLLITMVPFTVLAPVLGPAMDRTRGGRRLLVVLSAAGRGVLCVLMARHLSSLFLYPEAFAALVLQKGYTVAKSALVPTVVDDESELVRANSRLALISALAATVAGLPAAAILALLGGKWVLVCGAAVYAAASFAALGIPKAREVAAAETEEDRRELHAPAIVAGGVAMALMRGVVGFATFFLAFVLKDTGAPAWFYGALIAASGAGNLTGVIVAPRLRRWVREEWILAGALVAPAVVLIFTARAASNPALIVAGYAVAAGAGCSRQAFDSLVQREAHEAARGRAFARFETRFQLGWVIGGALAVALVPMTARAGLFAAAIVLGFGGLSYLRVARAAAGSPPSPPAAGPT